MSAKWEKLNKELSDDAHKSSSELAARVAELAPLAAELPKTKQELSEKSELVDPNREAACSGNGSS